MSNVLIGRAGRLFIFFLLFFSLGVKLKQIYFWERGYWNEMSKSELFCDM